VKVSAHAFCWDVVGDPSFRSRLVDGGIGSVTLAAAYHATRAATPLHPAHQTVDARHAALYRPRRPSTWRGRRLFPGVPEWVTSADSFLEASTSLTDAGVAVTAWVVLAHDSRLGYLYPDVAVTNCFGEPYPYALCPAHEEVAEYAATLAAEAVRATPAVAVSLESAGQMGLAHAGCHDKAEGGWSDNASRWLSVCCCRACRAGWAAQNLNADQVVTALRRAVREDGTPDARVMEAVLTTRHAAAEALRGRVVAAVREAAPGIAVMLHAQPDPWATGPSPGLRTGAGADALLTPAWRVGPAAVRAVPELAAFGLPVSAYVTVLPPADPADLDAHVRALVDAGASGVNLYHLGLASADRQRTFRSLSTMVATLGEP